MVCGPATAEAAQPKSPRITKLRITRRLRRLDGDVVMWSPRWLRFETRDASAVADVDPPPRALLPGEKSSTDTVPKV
jgi:hypothetical protein